MPNLKSIRNVVQDRLHDVSKRRQARADARKPRNAARRRVILKATLTLAMIAAFALLALMVGTSDYQATPIGWMPLIMLVSGIVLSWLYLQILKVSVGFEESSIVHDCRRDAEVNFSTLFRNKSILYVFRLKAYFFVSDLEGNVANESSVTMALSPRETYELPFATRFEHIGTYQAGLERIVLTDFIGLFEATIVNERRHSIHVSPKIQTIGNVEFSDDAETESDKALRAILAPSMDYAYVREYEPGDPLKTIHWKLSARSSGYMTKLFEVYTNPGVSVIIDTYGPSDDPIELMSLFDCVVEAGLTIADFARDQGLETELAFRDKHGANRKLTAWKKGALSRVVDDMPSMADSEELRQAALEMVEDMSSPNRGQNNLVVCTADFSVDMINAIVASRVNDRTPFMVAAIPPGLSERERQKRTAKLSRLDTAGISYIVISYSDELMGASL